ncbi:GDYXXLXY domain-containing protein [Alcaligenaceae bacterium]|nr:GDYXXLXY domain-containing protein [Alcaligenaceae bacterium]
MLASAAICWVAANWAQASAFQKLAGAQAVLIALVLITWRLVYVSGTSQRQNFSVSAHITGLAAVATGALLALVGQIYQTGADPWQLFLLWALLLLPWLLVMRTVFLALLGVVLLNVAAGLYLDIHSTSFWWGASSWALASVLLALLNLVLLVLWEYSIALLDDRWRIGPRVVGAGVLFWVVTAGWAWLDDGMNAVVLAMPGLMVCALGYWVYTRKRPDLALVSLAALAAYCQIVIVLLSWIDDGMGLLLISFPLIVMAGLLLRHLIGLVGPVKPDSETKDQKAARGKEPWFFSVVRLVIMGITTSLVVALPFISMNLAAKEVWPVGAVLGAGGLLLFRLGRGDILRELGTTLMAAGVFMVSAGLLLTSPGQPDIRVVGLWAMATALYVLAASPVLRFVCAFLAIATGLMLTWSGPGEYAIFELFDLGDSAEMWQVYLRLCLLAAAAILVWVGGSRRAEPAFWAPLGWALVCGAQAMAWLAPVPALYGWSSTQSALLVLWLACAVLPVLLLGALLWSQRALSKMVRLGATLALAVACVGWMGAPGIALALAWLILGYALGRRTLLVFGVVALLAYLARFYYQLDSTLLQKSLVLGLTGAWLLLSWLVLNKLAGRSAQRLVPPVRSPESRSWRVVGLLAGLALILVVVNTGIYQREQILATGQRVVLALAPVDPRSLIQGDYMALRFEAANQLQTLLARGPTALAEQIKRQQRGYLVLQPDAQGVHRVVSVLADYPGRVQDGTRPGQLILEFRLRNRKVKIVTDAWFFPEGQAASFERARYGEFRVDSKGTGLLTHMLDDRQNVLP